MVVNGPQTMSIVLPDIIVWVLHVTQPPPHNQNTPSEPEKYK